MFWHKARYIFLPVCIFLSAQSSFVLPNVHEETTTRMLRIVPSAGQPDYGIRVMARGKEGVIEISDGKSGVHIQTLTCPLITSSDPADLEIKTVGERFVAGFIAEDLDFDGFTDLRAPRDSGIKWWRDCVWLYDSQSHIFVKNLLAEQLELLYSFNVDRKRSRIISNSIGPYDPLWDEYRIESLGTNRPYWPRLIPVQSCFIETSAANAGSTAVIMSYEKRAPVVVRHSISSEATINVTDSTPEICKGP